MSSILIIYYTIVREGIKKKCNEEIPIYEGKKLASEMSINHNQRNKFSLVSLHVCSINSNGQSLFFCMYVSLSALLCLFHVMTFCLLVPYCSLSVFKLRYAKYILYKCAFKILWNSAIVKMGWRWWVWRKIDFFEEVLRKILMWKSKILLIS